MTDALDSWGWAAQCLDLSSVEISVAFRVQAAARKISVVRFDELSLQLLLQEHSTTQLVCVEGTDLKRTCFIGGIGKISSRIAGQKYKAKLEISNEFKERNLIQCGTLSQRKLQKTTAALYSMSLSHKLHWSQRLNTPTRES